MEITKFTGLEKHEREESNFTGTEKHEDIEVDFRNHEPSAIMKQAQRAVDSLSKNDAYENCTLWVAGNLDIGHPCYDDDCDNCPSATHRKCLTHIVTRFIDDNGKQFDYQEKYTKGGKVWCCGRPLYKGECYLCDQLS